MASTPPVAARPRPLWLKAIGSVADFGAYILLCRLAASLGLPREPVLPTWGALAALALAAFAVAEIVVTSEAFDPLCQLASKIPLVGPALYRIEAVVENGKGGWVAKGLLACHLCIGMWAGAGLCAAGLGLWRSADPTTTLVLHGMIGAALAKIVRARFS